MSGGSLCDYAQHHISDMWERIEEEIENNEELPYVHPQDGWEEAVNKWFIENGGKKYSDETIAEFRNGIEALKRAYVYAQRIDWLISGDDGEESFHERLKEELKDLKKED